MPYIRANIDQLTKINFKHAAKNKGMTESELLRLMVAQVIGENSENVDLPNRSNRVQLMFTEKEFFRVKKRARADGYLRHTSWMVGIVRSILNKKPNFAAEEISILRESNREMAAIGRNLNQIAKAINIDWREVERLKRADIKELSNDLLKHRRYVGGLIDHCLNRWMG